jgi:hypothetical protein
MDRIIRTALTLMVGILLLAVIVGFYLAFRVGPHQGLIMSIIQSIGKLFGA